MKKFLFIASLIAGFFILHSCVDPNSLVNSNASTLTGPRALSRVDSSGVTVAKYHFTNNKLTGATMFDYQMGVPNPNAGTVSLVYSGDKISVFDYLFITDPGTPQAAQQKASIKLTYDGSGKVISTLTEFSQITANSASIPISRYEGTLAYDSSGKIIKQFQKIGFWLGGVYNYSMYSEDLITYTGSNISKVENRRGTLSSSGVPTGTSTLFVTTTAENFDSKISPYTTLPKEFNLCWGVLDGSGMYYLNPNNHQKFTFTENISGSSFSAVQNFSMQYDTQNYLTAASYQKFVYQAL